MDESEIVKIFLKSGFQPDKAVLDFFKESPRSIDEFLQYMRNQGKTIFITKDHLRNFLPHTKSEITLAFQFRKTEKTYTIEDLVRTLQVRYEKIHNMLTNRIDLPSLISINKISEKTNQFSITGIVADVEEAVTIEDRTGKTTLPFAKNTVDKEILSEGDVAGFFCESSDRGTEIKKIIFPDIPLRKEISKTGTDIQCFFSTHEYGEVGKNIFTFILSGDGIQVSSDGGKIFYNDPCIVNINGLKIFVSNGKFLEKFRGKLGESAAKIMLNLARKRRLPIGTEEIILEEVPDVFVVNSFGEPDEINYKGTSFLSLGDGRVAWKVDLRSRENVKIHFN